MKIPGKFPLSILVALAACTWVAVGFVLYGTKPDIGFFKPMSLVTGVLATVLAAYDRWIWRIPGLAAVHGIPNLNGTWIGEIRSMWKDPATGQVPAPVIAAIVIRQTYTAVSIRMFTDQSSSVSVAARIEPEADGRINLMYVYRNEPRLSLQDRSRVHHGGVRFALGGAADVLEGAYWSDRDSKGEMVLKRKSRKHALDFESAQKIGNPQSSS